MKNKQIYNILFVLTDSYVLYSCPLIISIIKQCSRPVNFYYITPDISENHKTLLRTFLQEYDSHAYFIHCDVKKFSGLYSTERYPLFLYAKMIPHHYLPNNLHRILGLDIDTLVYGNIDDLYNIDFNDQFLLVACHNKRSLTNLWKSQADNIFFQEGFNGGVILYNLDMFRVSVTMDTYFLWINEYTKQTGLPQRQFEEWIMSNSLSGKYKLLMPFDYNYNLSANDLYQNYCLFHNISPLQRIIHFQNNTKNCILSNTYGKPWEYYRHFILKEPSNITQSYIYKFYEQWWAYARTLPKEILNYYNDER